MANPSELPQIEKIPDQLQDFVCDHDQANFFVHGHNRFIPVLVTDRAELEKIISRINHAWPAEMFEILSVEQYEKVSALKD